MEELEDKEKLFPVAKNQQDIEGGFIKKVSLQALGKGSYHAYCCIIFIRNSSSILEECKRWLAAHRDEGWWISRTIYVIHQIQRTKDL